jgi:hydrogenase maturation protease
VRLVDGGTAGPQLLPIVAGCDGLMVLDAVEIGGQPGDVVRVDLESGSGGLAPRTVHDLGLETLLQDLRLLGEFPKRAILFGIQPASIALGTGLSPPVAQGLARLVGAALDELARWAQPPDDAAGTGNGDVNASTEDEK